jgi:hypothetical protein
MRSVSQDREVLLRRLSELARRALFGTLSETYRTCGQPSCRCHHGGPKHGPHLYVSFRGEQGKTAGFYVPKALTDQMRAGVVAWRELEELLRKLAELNRKRLWASRAGQTREGRARGRGDGSSRVSAAKRL